MDCVICKTGEVRPAAVQAEVKVGSDRLLVPVEAEACQECGEAYYSTEALAGGLKRAIVSILARPEGRALHTGRARKRYRTPFTVRGLEFVEAPG